MFPLVLLEAFRQKTPAIVRRLGGLTEVADESGAAIAYADDAGLALALRRLLKEPGLREDMGRSGFDAFQRHWTPEVHLDRYFSVIDKARQARS